MGEYFYYIDVLFFELFISPLQLYGDFYTLCIIKNESLEDFKETGIIKIFFINYFLDPDLSVSLSKSVLFNEKHLIDVEKQLELIIIEKKNFLVSELINRLYFLNEITLLNSLISK